MVPRKTRHESIPIIVGLLAIKDASEDIQVVLDIEAWKPVVERSDCMIRDLTMSSSTQYYLVIYRIERRKKIPAEDTAFDQMRIDSNENSSMLFRINSYDGGGGGGGGGSDGGGGGGRGGGNNGVGPQGSSAVGRGGRTAVPTSHAGPIINIPDDDSENDFQPPPRTSKPPSTRPPPRRPTPPPKPPASRNDDSGQIHCSCGPAVQRTVVKESASKGRLFWTCPNKPGCDFFKWDDDVAGPSNRTIPTKRPFSNRQEPSVNESESRRCRCNLTAVRKTVQKESQNKGRMFWICPNSDAARCSFFEWDDEPPRTEPTHDRPPAASGSGSSKPGTCFKCNEEGHWANECPNEGGPNQKRSRSFGSEKANFPRSNSGKSGSCFKCNQEGHWSSECPNDGAPSRSSRGSRGSRGRGRGSRGGSTRGKRGRGAAKSRSGGYSAPDEF